MIQRSVGQLHTKAFAGLYPEDGSPVLLSHVAEIDIWPGTVVVLMPSEGVQDIDSQPSGTPYGVSVYMPRLGAGVSAVGQTIPIMRRGRVWAYHDGAPTVGGEHPLLPGVSRILEAGYDIQNDFHIAFIDINIG